MELKEAWACFTSLGMPQSTSEERWGSEWGSTEAPQSPGWQGQHKALTGLAVLPYIAHGARACVAPAKVFTGSTILTGAREAWGGHWKSRAKSICCGAGRAQKPEPPPPAGCAEELKHFQLEQRGLKASSEAHLLPPQLSALPAAPTPP